MSEMAAPRRWRRIVLWVVGVLGLMLVVAVVVAFWAAPGVAVRVAQGHLPYVVAFPEGQVVIAAVATRPAGGHPECQVEVTPRRARLLAQAALARWLPGGLVRSGQCVDGQLALPGLRARPLSWQLLAGGMDDAPQLSLRVPAADLDRVLLERAVTESALPGGATMQVTYVVDEGTIDDDDLPGHPPLVRRFKVVARGRIIVEAFRLRRVIEVRRIAGHALATFVPEGGLLHLGCTVAIEEAEADELKLPLIGDLQGVLLQQLEAASNRGLAKGLARALLPTWFPTDVQVAVEVTPSL